MSTKWLEKEIIYLKENYSKVKSLKDLDLERSEEEILKKAEIMCLWSKKDLSNLKKYYPKQSKKIITDKINKSWESIARKASTLKISRKNFWTEKEIILLKKLYPNKNKNIILEKINRDWDTIKTKAYKLGLKSNSSWQNDELDVIKNIYAFSSKIQIQNALPTKSWAAIVQKAESLNLKRDKNVVMSDIYATKKLNKTLGGSSSKGESLFYKFLKKHVDEKTKRYVETPYGLLDFYSPKLDMFIQYDGNFTHGKNTSIQRLENLNLSKTSRLAGVLRTMKKDLIQNNNIKNLKRVWDLDFLHHHKNKKVLDFFKSLGFIQ